MTSAAATATPVPGASAAATPRASAPRVAARGTVAPGRPAIAPFSADASLATTGPTWTSLGPGPITDEKIYVSTPPQDIGAASGRVTALAVNPTNSKILFAGAAGGGVWKTLNGGGSWQALTDTQASLNIGALAIDKTGSVLFAGTGNDDASGDALPGQGILKTTNGGTSWKLLGSTQFQGHHVGGLAIDRLTSGTTMHVFAATDAGLWESLNAGSTWTRNLSIQANAPGQVLHVEQVVQDPTTATTFWATTADECAISCAGGVMVSVNSGKDWAPSLIATNGNVGRVSIGVGTGGVVYAAVADASGNLSQVSKRSGASGWALTTQQPSNYFNLNGGGNGQGTYDNVVAVDPTNSSHVILGGIDAMASTDGGQSWHSIGLEYTAPSVIHPDFHAIAYVGPSEFYIGNDGGVWHTSDNGGTGGSTDWQDVNGNLNIAQLYGGQALDTNNVLGAAQDNGLNGYLGSASTKWTHFASVGDSTLALIDPTAGVSDRTFYTSAFGMDLTQYTVNGDPSQGVAAEPCINNCPDVSYTSRPVVMDPTNPKRLLAGTDHLYESRNQTTYTAGVPAGLAPSGGWTQISPLLTTGSNGDALTKVVMGPAGETNTVFTASGAGAINRTTDDGATWTTITGNLPTGGKAAVFTTQYLSGLDFNPWDTAEAWVSFSNTTGGIWHTTTASLGGATWSNISGSLNEPITSLTVDARDPNVLYAGTATGVYVCTKCGTASATPNWAKFGLKLPNVWVSSLTWTRDHRNLVAWTYGRGAWIVAPPDVSKVLSTDFATPTGGSNTHGIANGPDGVWFTEFNGGHVGRVNWDGKITEWAIPGAVSLSDITLGPDGDMWFTDTGANMFGSISPNGTTIHTFTSTLQPSSNPRGIAAGPDGNLYIAASGLSTGSPPGQVYVVNTAGTELARQVTPTQPSGPYEIVAGRDGSMYFTEFLSHAGTGGDSKIGVITTDAQHTVTELTVPNATLGPIGITVGPDGNIWYTEYGNNSAGVYRNGAFQEFPVVPNSNHAPVGITGGLDGNLWMADQNPSAAEARMSITGTVKTFADPTTTDGPYEIVAGPDGNLWYTAAAAGAIGVIRLSVT